jgi:hypothetical protein
MRGGGNMNSETGEIKKLSELTEAERKSGKWVKLPAGVNYLPSKPLTKSELKREEYMKRVLEKKAEGLNV